MDRDVNHFTNFAVVYLKNSAMMVYFYLQFMLEGIIID